jgi:hypothetical protein
MTDIQVTATHASTGEPADPKDLDILEEAGIAYNPADVTLDLTKAEKRRTTALMLAIQAYGNLIIKDAEMYREVKLSERNGGPVIQPATMDAMVRAAIQFDLFISGELQRIAAATKVDLESSTEEPDDPRQP